MEQRQEFGLLGIATPVSRERPQSPPAKKSETPEGLTVGKVLLTGVLGIVALVAFTGTKK
jgi:hypothetical protein